MRNVFWIAGIALALLVAGCGHHHWVREGTSEHDAGHFLEDCERAASRGGKSVGECMREQGFEWEGHPHSSVPSATVRS